MDTRASSAFVSDPPIWLPSHQQTQLDSLPTDTTQKVILPCNPTQGCDASSMNVWNGGTPVFHTCQGQNQHGASHQPLSSNGTNNFIHAFPDYQPTTSTLPVESTPQAVEYHHQPIISTHHNPHDSSSAFAGRGGHLQDFAFPNYPSVRPCSPPMQQVTCGRIFQNESFASEFVSNHEWKASPDSSAHHDPPIVSASIQSHVPNANHMVFANENIAYNPGHLAQSSEQIAYPFQNTAHTLKIEHPLSMDGLFPQQVQPQQYNIHHSVPLEVTTAPTNQQFYQQPQRPQHSFAQAPGGQQLTVFGSEHKTMPFIVNGYVHQPQVPTLVHQPHQPPATTQIVTQTNPFGSMNIQPHQQQRTSVQIDGMMTTAAVMTSGPPSNGQGQIKIVKEQSQHSPITHPHECEQCGKRYKHKCNLITHRKIHSSSAPTCQYCGKRFTNKKDLVRHERTHTGVKPYSCDVCGKRFNDQANRRKHMGLHTGMKKYSCAFCKKQFCYRSSVKRHIGASDVCQRMFNASKFASEKDAVIPVKSS